MTHILEATPWLFDFKINYIRTAISMNNFIRITDEVGVSANNSGSSD